MTTAWTVYDHQQNPWDSPWTMREKIGLLIWWFAWPLLCAWTPRPANSWRLFILRMFGTRIDGRPEVHPRTRIQVPWRLTLHDRACIGDRTNLYSLGEIEVGEGSTVAQEAYVCTGSHAFDRPAWNLVTAKIVIEPHAFIGARAFIMPGIRIGTKSIVSACSVVTHDVEPGVVVAGNPARVIKQRA